MGNGRSIFVDKFFLEIGATKGAAAPPETPLAIEANILSAASFRANWTPALGATSYRLDVSLAKDFSSFIPGYENLSVAGTSCIVSGVPLSQTYYYRVRAINSAGSSGNSNYVAVTALAIFIVAAGNLSANGATIIWATNKESDSLVRFGTDADNLTESVYSSGLTKYHSAALLGLAMETLYYYQVTSETLEESVTSGLYTFSTSKDYTVTDVGHLFVSSVYNSENILYVPFEKMFNDAEEYNLTTEPDASGMSDVVVSTLSTLSITGVSVTNTPGSDYTAATN